MINRKKRTIKSEEDIYEIGKRKDDMSAKDKVIIIKQKG